jgi:hypothetical protein
MRPNDNTKVEEDQDFVDDEDKKPAAVVFATAGNVTQTLVATTGNETQSLAKTTGTATHALTATTGNMTQSLAATTSNAAQSLAATTSNVTQSTLAATDSAAHSPTFSQSNTEAELASFSPEMIAEDAAARELLLERHLLMPQVIETLLTIFHPIICLQLLNVLPFIYRWLQMILPPGKSWKKIAKQRRY